MTICKIIDIQPVT